MLKTVLLALVLFILPLPALAQLPASCYTYSLDDSFDGSGWSPWNLSSTGVIQVGNTNSARTGSNAALFSFSSQEPINGMLIIDKTFGVAGTTSRSRLNRNGCAHTIPWLPVGQPKYCSASMWVRPASGGAAGILQLLDASYGVIATTNFSNTGNSWFKVSIPSTVGCVRNMVVRIALSRTSTSSNAMVVDDVHIDWNY